jgi:hypothetical protein
LDPFNEFKDSQVGYSDILGVSTLTFIVLGVALLLIACCSLLIADLAGARKGPDEVDYSRDGDIIIFNCANVSIVQPVSACHSTINP